jgi:hypothetical protein
VPELIILVTAVASIVLEGAAIFVLVYLGARLAIKHERRAGS